MPQGMLTVKRIDSLMKSHHHSATGRVQYTESMRPFQLHQLLRSGSEAVSPRELKSLKHAKHSDMKKQSLIFYSLLWTR